MLVEHSSIYVATWNSILSTRCLCPAAVHLLSPFHAWQHFLANKYVLLVLVLLLLLQSHQYSANPSTKHKQNCWLLYQSRSPWVLCVCVHACVCMGACDVVEWMIRARERKLYAICYSSLFLYSLQLRSQPLANRKYLRLTLIFLSSFISLSITKIKRPKERIT